MATYLELYDLQNEDALLHRVSVAIIIAADTIRQESDATPNHANRLIWASEAFASPGGMTKQALWAVLAANDGNTVAQIMSATDAQIQTNVDAVVDVLAGS